MTPPSAVCGLYFAHPERVTSAIGKLLHDQVADYARRAGLGVREAERWLAPNLGYDPAAATLAGGGGEPGREVGEPAGDA
jgi:5-methyltetrahydrofolate--homocysteine methyltransferase